MGCVWREVEVRTTAAAKSENRGSGYRTRQRAIALTEPPSKDEEMLTEEASQSGIGPESAAHGLHG
jgi:hypothetical protein